MTGNGGASLIGPFPSIFRFPISPPASDPCPARLFLPKFGRDSRPLEGKRRFSLRARALSNENWSALPLLRDGRWSRRWTAKIGELHGFSDCDCRPRAVKKPDTSASAAAGPEEPPSPPVNSERRLFSTLNVATLQHEPGSLAGSILLVAGTTVGAGILAIPAVTQDAGFLPSAGACVLCWAYMVATGLLVAEVNLTTMCSLGSGGVSLVSMAFRTLGRPGVRIACVSYLFIHYALLVAYVARSSEIVSAAVGSPLWVSGSMFTLLLGGLCYFGSQRAVDAANGVLVVGVVASFAVLVGAAAGGLELERLLRVNVAAVPESVPIIALSFVYQNVVPVICSSLEGDPAKIRAAIVLGTAIPLGMFLLWDALILGSLPESSNHVFEKVVDPLLRLQAGNGVVGPVVQVFSLLAVATSYIGFVLGLADFLADLLKLPIGGSSKQALPYVLTLVPPLALALTSPGIFFAALDFAGTYGVLVLFGILPAAMAWSERYSDTCLPASIPPLLPGGRLALGAIMAFAGLVVSSDLLSHALPFFSPDMLQIQTPDLDNFTHAL